MKEGPHQVDNPGPLDPELRALVDDARRSDAMDTAYGSVACERVLARVEVAVAEASVSDDEQRGSTEREGAAPAGSAGVGPKLVGLRAGLMLTSAFLLAALVASMFRDSVGAKTAPALPPSALLASPPPSADEVPPPSAPTESEPRTFHVHDLPSSTASAPPSHLARAPRPDSPPGQATGPKGSGLVEEYTLIESARAKLAAKDYPGALRSVREHDERFPTGQLTQECESLHIQALVETGRLTEARERAQRFRTRFPNGLLLPAVARAIGEGATDAASP